MNTTEGRTEGDGGEVGGSDGENCYSLCGARDGVGSGKREGQARASDVTGHLFAGFCLPCD